MGEVKDEQVHLGDFWHNKPARRALRAVTELRRSLDALERRLVVEARHNQVTWQEIGADLGISKQTAHRRHIAQDRSPRGGERKLQCGRS